MSQPVDSGHMEEDAVLADGDDEEVSFMIIYGPDATSVKRDDDHFFLPPQHRCASHPPGNFYRFVVSGKKTKQNKKKKLTKNKNQHSLKA